MMLRMPKRMVADIWGVVSAVSFLEGVVLPPVV